VQAALEISFDARFIAFDVSDEAVEDLVCLLPAVRTSPAAGIGSKKFFS